ncbi:helix-turn-helix domain-containing protein [Actinoplanes derwentensis]|uniref:Helix-turn-helix domain-containing protein n=1 Tax=Actinoplanes derwentensis TaxID=113562 RepID=A0A1H1WRR2_9ACTN|nr:helix-turn-helix transcriptional regulator [Actinoplanes derwentensis]GID86997.1 hypothetical protein Ade03nite_59210 [Actinoplanes derwentensis]SDS99722.1 Helix-turn-helix domain-containing protein [Actinoplanes derwentensis]
MNTDGFPAALRRWRTRRRVSQLELATRAGTTQRHVSFLESGRSTPGRAMIVRLAESIEAPLQERNELLLTAGFAPAYPQTDLDDPRLGPIKSALTTILYGHQPYPVVVVDRHGDLIMANASFGTLVGGVGTATDVAVAELRLEAFLPADEATAAALAGLR